MENEPKPWDLAAAILDLARVGGMPASSWYTDRRIALACQTLKINPANAERWAQANHELMGEQNGVAVGLGGSCRPPPSGALDEMQAERPADPALRHCMRDPSPVGACAGEAHCSCECFTCRD